MALLFRISFGLVTLVTAVGLYPQAPTEVILVARRTGVAEVLHADTLETAARVHFDFQVERLSAGADGFHLEASGYTAGGSCCRHYLLDLATAGLQQDGPSVDRGPYGACLLSPDGRWCFRLKSFRGPALQIVDMQQPGSARELVPPGLPEENSEGNWAASGVWAGSRFYLYVQRPNDPGWLWTVLPGATELGAGIRVAPFGEAQGCRDRLPVTKSLVAAAGRLFLYEPFGGMADRTAACRTALSGGAWELDPATGQLLRQIAPRLYFNGLLADRSGEALYGVALGGVAQGGRQGSEPVRLVRLNARDGQVLQSRTFEPGVLNISGASLVTVPAGDLSAHDILN